MSSQGFFLGGGFDPQFFLGSLLYVHRYCIVWKGFPQPAKNAENLWHLTDFNIKFCCGGNALSPLWVWDTAPPYPHFITPHSETTGFSSRCIGRCSGMVTFAVVKVMEVMKWNCLFSHTFSTLFFSCTLSVLPWPNHRVWGHTVMILIHFVWKCDQWCPQNCTFTTVSWNQLLFGAVLEHSGYSHEAKHNASKITFQLKTDPWAVPSDTWPWPWPDEWPW